MTPGRTGIHIARQEMEKLSRNDFASRTAKRILDVSVALILLPLLIIPIILLIFAARYSTGLPGLFRQERIGREGIPFVMYKIRTLRGMQPHSATEIAEQETAFGGWLRRTKLDELPQLFNVLTGDMSLVGPRPDVPGYADRLEGEDRIILSVRPGITGPATLKYRNEEKLLRQQKDPERYNDTVIWPDKVKINKAYVRNLSFRKDLVYLYKSIINKR